METQVRTFASAITTPAKHDLAVTLSGRDITLTGTANSDTEAASLTALADQVGGHRVVLSDLTILRVAAPYVTTITKMADDTYGATGAISTDRLRINLIGTTPALGTLTLASNAARRL